MAKYYKEATTREILQELRRVRMQLRGARDRALEFIPDLEQIVKKLQLQLVEIRRSRK